MSSNCFWADIFVASLPTNPPSLTPDNDVFEHLATVYSQSHLTMHKGESCGRHFKGGIINGAAWYSLIGLAIIISQGFIQIIFWTGGMQDYNYVFHGCMEITLEISCCKYPHVQELPQLWKENKMVGVGTRRKFPIYNFCFQGLAQLLSGGSQGCNRSNRGRQHSSTNCQRILARFW